MSEKVSVRSDQAGIASAVLCTVHCLVIPALFVLRFSLTDNAAYHLPQWWEKLDYVFLVVSFLAVYHSANHAKAREVKAALWLFWGILAVAILFQAQLHWMAYIASAGLIATHFLNIRQIRKANKAETLANKKRSIV